MLTPILTTPKVSELLHGEDVCLNVKCSFLDGMWWLAGSVVLSMALTQFVAFKARGQLSVHQVTRSRKPSVYTGFRQNSDLMPALISIND